MKRWINVYVALIMLAGCAGITKDDIIKLNAEHKKALATVAQKVESADAHLAAIPNPPQEVTAAREDLAEAKPAIVKAQEIGEKVAQAAVVTVEKNEKLNEAIIGPRGKAILIGAGTLAMLIGLAIVLLRYGKVGGFIAAIPILGAVVARISSLFAKRK